MTDLINLENTNFKMNLIRELELMFYKKCVEGSQDGTEWDLMISEKFKEMKLWTINEIRDGEEKNA